MRYLIKFNESINDFYVPITYNEFRDQTEDDSNYCQMGSDVLDRIFDEFPMMKIDEDEDDCLVIHQGRFHFTIIQSRDEWFFVRFFDSSLLGSSISDAYKCDQLDGLIKLMSDKLPKKSKKLFENNPFDRSSQDKVRYYLFWKDYLSRDEFIQGCKQSISNHNRVYDKSDIMTRLSADDVELRFEEIEDYFIDLDDRFRVDFNFVAGKTSYFGVLLFDMECDIHVSTKNLISRIQRSRPELYPHYLGYDKLSLKFNF